MSFSCLVPQQRVSQLVCFVPILLPVTFSHEWTHRVITAQCADMSMSLYFVHNFVKWKHNWMWCRITNKSHAPRVVSKIDGTRWRRIFIIPIDFDRETFSHHLMSCVSNNMVDESVLFMPQTFHLHLERAFTIFRTVIVEKFNLLRNVCLRVCVCVCMCCILIFYHLIVDTWETSIKQVSYMHLIPLLIFILFQITIRIFWSS